MQIEGINYRLNGQEFSVGSSFFIPCLDDIRAKAHIERKMKRLNFAITIKLVVEDGVRGLRVWRIRR